MKYIYILSFILFLFIISETGNSQIVEGDLYCNPVQNEQYNKEKTYPERTNKSNKKLVIDLPFMDDFSRYSLPTNNPEIPTDWQRWEDKNVFLNNTFPFEPPTIGVVTFDGLDSTGYPYDFGASGTEHLPSDTLTSMPINLEGLEESDNVHLTFFYQTKGLGNSPEVEDSLKLEFKIGDGVWVTKWIIPGSEVLSITPFQQVFIEVWDDQFGNFYFQDDFQFRFIGYSEQRGNLDHWHLDYVYMDENIDPETFFFSDLAIMDPKNTLLNASLTAMPWAHYIDNPASHMIPNTTTLMERNLANSDFNFRSGFKVTYEGVVQEDHLNSGSNTSGNQGIIETAIDFNTSTEPFEFDPLVNDTCAEFKVQFFHEFKDNLTPQNDTTSFNQVFSNYFAYDDGSAERTFAFTNNPGANIAVKFDSYIEDTLIGLLIHFIPYQTNASNESFILRAWEDDSGEPGDELNENFSFKYPSYYTSGQNVFGYYEYDNPVPVSGDFYVGWVQQEADRIPLGLDKNTNANPIATFYKNSTISNWQQLEIEGSLMVRPVLKARKSDNPSVNISEQEASYWSIYPNPASDMIRIQTLQNKSEGSQLSITDAVGKLILDERMANSQTSIDITSWNTGIYFVQITEANGQITRHKFIKSK